MLHMSCVTFHLCPVTCPLSPVPLTTTLCSFSCHESPKRFGNAAAGGLVIDKTNLRKNAKMQQKKSHQGDRHKYRYTNSQTSQPLNPIGVGDNSIKIMNKDFGNIL